MNKVLTLGAVLVSALATGLSTPAAAADSDKHLGRGHGYGHGHASQRPLYVAPGAVRNHYAPTRGYWHGGRWIAPVVVGGIIAAAVGANYAHAAPAYGYGSYNNYNHYNDYNSYTAPSYHAPVAVTYVAPVRTGFDHADSNRDGYVSYDEAVAHPHWQRNFGFIDRNRDGYLSRDEVNGWRYR